MPEFWETAFTDKELMWGLGATRSALFACDYFARHGVHNVLIPGLGYGRNARPFLDQGMSVTGIEISASAIELARSRLNLHIPIHHGSVEDMPFDSNSYDGIFCHGLIYLLDTAGRGKLISECARQLSPNGLMIFSVISKKAPMFGQGTKLGEDWYERLPGLGMYFYDAESIEREFGEICDVETSEIDEPSPNGESLPFINVVCSKK